MVIHAAYRVLIMTVKDPFTNLQYLEHSKTTRYLNTLVPYTRKRIDDRFSILMSLIDKKVIVGFELKDAHIKDGDPKNDALSDIVLRVIKEHLKVKVECKYGSNYSLNNNQNLEVSLLINEESISSDYSTITIPEND